MIRSFKDLRTKAVFAGENPKGFPSAILKVARRKLRMLHAAARLDDLRMPPHNFFEALKKDRAGQYAIRINRQFRVCFRWTGKDAEDVEIVDYH